MPWGERPGRGDLLAWYRRLVALRRATPGRWAGPRRTVLLDDDAGTYAVRIGDDAGASIIVLNLSARAATRRRPGPERDSTSRSRPTRASRTTAWRSTCPASRAPCWPEGWRSGRTMDPRRAPAHGNGVSDVERDPAVADRGRHRGPGRHPHLPLDRVDRRPAPVALPAVPRRPVATGRPGGRRGPLAVDDARPRPPAGPAGTP